MEWPTVAMPIVRYFKLETAKMKKALKRIKMSMKKIVKHLKNAGLFTLGVLYYPIYVFGWVLQKVSSILLALSYILGMKPHRAWRILSNLFY